MHALDYQITIHSSLTVDDTLCDAYVNQLNSVTTVQGPLESKGQIQLHLGGEKILTRWLVCQMAYQAMARISYL